MHTLHMYIHAICFLVVNSSVLRKEIVLTTFYNFDKLAWTTKNHAIYGTN